MTKQTARIVVVGGGAGACLITALTGLVLMHFGVVKFEDSYFIPIAIGGVFVFTRLVDTFFE